MLERVSGLVEEIIYRNEENGYTIMNVVVDKDFVTLVGNLFHVSVGEQIEAVGEYVKHSVYGEQFKVESFETVFPNTNDGIKAYLASGAIKGVKAVLAGKIVSHFGDETLYVLEQDPLRLKEVKGISLKKAQDIGEQFQEQLELRNAFMFLNKYNISYNFSVKIFKKYKNKCYDIIKENPYVLADDIEGISFKKADEIAYKTGVDRNSEFRIASCIKYVLNNHLLNGHVYLARKELKEEVLDLIEIAEEDFENGLILLSMKNEVIIDVVNEDENNIYLASLYTMEKFVALKLLELERVEVKTEIDIDAQIEQLEDEFELIFEEKQKRSVKEVIRNNVLVITGGPGTGKTTTLDGILKIFKKNGIKTLLAAPTGRAAKRMAEATSYEAKTIHRLLEVVVDEEGNNGFMHNEENPLECDAIIIDEVSMLDTWLFYHLLKAVSIGTKLVLVGDKDQLPSVGAGNILNDIIKSGTINTEKLDVIFRQKEESDIVMNAHRINAGQMISLNNKNDFFVIKRDNATASLKEIISLVQTRLPKYLDTTDKFDIQVLSPMKKGPLGVAGLNTELQAVMNPKDKAKREKAFKDITFRQGDKVMQIKNNYDIEWKVYNKLRYVIDEGNGVFNGDIGTVLDINEYTETLTVLFDDDREVDYKFKQLDELVLSYAVTIHKSQGSEYKCVIIPIFKGPPMLLTRNLLYTAVTRAKNLVVLVGDIGVVKTMINNNFITKRNSSLDRRLREYKELL